jgi:ribosomal protein L14
MGGFICEDGAYDLDWTTINARRYANYSGYNAAQSAIILTEVVRFGERCLALAVKETQVLITSSMYTDLPTLTTLYQYFVHNYASIMLKIEGMTATCRVGDNTGALIKEVKTTFNDKWATVGQCITMPLKDGSGRSVKMTIKQALIAQAEAAFWMIKWNMNKLTGRIAQLEDPTAVLLPEDTTVPFQFDPWKNPFLLLDIKESKDDATAYRNVASSTAPQYEDPTYTRRDSAGNIVVTNNFVPTKYMRMADSVAARLTRVQLPGGGYASPDEIGTTGKSPALLIAMAAASAAAIYFTVKG